MKCCGHALTHRNWMSGRMLTSVGAMLAGGAGPRGSTIAAKTAETASTALGALRKSIPVDVHTHGGKTGITLSIHFISHPAWQVVRGGGPVLHRRYGERRSV